MKQNSRTTFVGYLRAKKTSRRAIVQKLVYIFKKLNLQLSLVFRLSIIIYKQD